jgi:5'-phosphate synthase pdxT subunit
VGVRIGVLALQGDVSEHLLTFREALRSRESPGNDRVFPVRTREVLRTCDALAIPGGESTTISRLIGSHGLYKGIQEFEGIIFATCAGMVLLGNGADDPRIHTLGLIDMGVERNAFGRQRESFEAEIEIQGLASPFHAIFIRAPLVTRIGRGVEVLSRIPEGIVGVRMGGHMAFSFHPELTKDLRLHELFLAQLENA